MLSEFSKRLIMMFAMAVNVSAQTIDVSTSAPRYIKSFNTSSDMYLNLEGNGNAYQNRNVTVYNPSGDDDQKWRIYDRGNGYKVYAVKSDANSNLYTLNINRSNCNCNIYYDDRANNQDSQVNTIGDASSFEIELAGGTYAGFNLAIVPGGRNVNWGSVDTYSWALIQNQ